MAFIKATGHAFNMKDLVANLPYKKLKLTCKTCREITSDGHKDEVAKIIFREHFILVLNDIIYNGTVFWLPTLKMRSCIKMQSTTGEQFKKLRKLGKWKDFDLIASNFTGYQLGFFMYGNRTPRIKAIYVNEKLKKAIADKVNAGFSYGDTKNDKCMNDYIQPVADKFPNVHPQDIIRIVRYIWRQIYKLCSYGGDVLIKNRQLWCYFGRLPYDSLEYFKYYINKLSIKIKLNYYKQKLPFSGYYYFGLTQKQYDEFINSKHPRTKWFTFKNIVLYEILEECKIKNSGCPYIYRIPYYTRISHSFFKKELTTKDAELIIVREPLKFKDILVSQNKYEFV